MRAIEVRAPLIALAAAAFFGVSTPLAKALIGDISPWLLAGLLYLGSGIGLTILFLVRRSFAGGSGEANLARADLPWLVGTVFFGGILGPIFLLYGLALTDAASASLLLNLEAVAAARVFGATVWLSDSAADGLLPAVLDAEGIPWRRTSVR